MRLYRSEGQVQREQRRLIVRLYYTLDVLYMDDEKAPARTRQDIRKEMDDAEKK